MIRNITSSGIVSPTILAQTPSAQAVAGTSSVSLPIADIVSIDPTLFPPTSFSVTSPIEDYLSQGKHVSSKKHFKNNKEYIAYLLLLDARMKKIEEKNNGQSGGQGAGFFAPLEDRAEYNKLKNEMSELTSANIL